ncbi:unnamed protein product [Colias eurytheme]|nr:unnamed protein product [Colias eurytheme]
MCGEGHVCKETIYLASTDLISQCQYAIKRIQSREERLEKKRIAERLRYERLKQDPQKWEEVKKKGHQKYLEKIEKGTVKLVKDMTSREHKAAKQRWKKYSSQYRAKKEALSNSQ